MIITRCPLRVSLVGGGTDLQEFVKKNGEGAVVSFPCNLYTYITLAADKNGYNAVNKKYIINYTNREIATSIKEIKNDVAREALDHYDMPPLSVGFYTDVFSIGSGLASSSSYLVALIKSIQRFKNELCTDQTTAEKALELERKFNPLTGAQDPYGCALGNLKKLQFFPNGRVISSVYENNSLFKYYDCYLIYTGVTRSSTDILSTLDLNRVEESLPLVDELTNAIHRENHERCFEIISEGWKIKKETSKSILGDQGLLDMDQVLSTSPDVKTHKLCGAGAGGYFLAFVEADSPCYDLDEKIKDFKNRSFKIKPDIQGVQSANIGGAAVFM